MIIQFHRIVLQLTISLINTLSSTETRKFEHDLRSSTTMFREQHERATRASYSRELRMRVSGMTSTREFTNGYAIVAFHTRVVQTNRT